MCFEACEMHSNAQGNRVILAVSDADEPTDQNAVGTLIEARSE